MQISQLKVRSTLMKYILSVNEKRIYVIDITFGINESIFSGNEQQKVYMNITSNKIKIKSG